MNYLILVISMLFCVSCSSPDVESEVNSGEKKAMSEVSEVIAKIDHQLKLIKGAAQVAKGTTAEEFSNLQNRLVEVDTYSVTKQFEGGIELEVRFRTYLDPQEMDAGEIRLRYPKGLYEVSPHKVKPLVERYVLGFMKVFVEDEKLLEQLLLNAEELKGNDYVPSGQTQQYLGYRIDCYRRQDFVHWKTHEVVAFVIE